MRTYRTTEEVPWKDVLAILRWYLEMNLTGLEIAERYGKDLAQSPYYGHLQTACAASSSLRRFLGRGETRTERKAADLLARIS